MMPMRVQSASHSSLYHIIIVWDCGASTSSIRAAIRAARDKGDASRTYMLCVVSMTQHSPRLVVMSEITCHMKRRATGSMPVEGSVSCRIVREGETTRTWVY